MDAVERCRELLEALTPLSGDCGRLCGVACCQPLEGEDTGMLLFPGEERLFDGLDGFSLQATAAGTLLRCGGACERSARPLSCRLFPLLPVLRPDGVHVAVDCRARAVCPLAGQGLRAMHPDFREAVRQCGEILCTEEATRAFLQELTRQQDDLRALQAEWGGGFRHA